MATSNKQVKNAPPTLTELTQAANNEEVKLSAEQVNKPAIDDGSIVKFIEEVATYYNLTLQHALVAISIIFQKGGLTATKSASKINITINGRKIEAGRVCIILKETTSGKTTPRQMAKAMSDTIFQISKKYNIPGNIHLDLQRTYTAQYEAITDSDKIYWAADFHSDNQKAPSEIRALIAKRFNEKVNTKSKKST
jgi:hypothetical protein